MREILFRAKAINRIDGLEYRTKYKNGDWVFGLLSKPYHNFNGYIQPAEMRNTDGVDGIDVDHETLGQYTGLTDKNGVRIFEGDIVQSTESGMKALVQYFPEHGAFMLWCREESVNQVEYIGEVEMLMVKVIGNIHDSIELFPEYAGGDDHAAD